MGPGLLPWDGSLEEEGNGFCALNWRPLGMSPQVQLLISAQDVENYKVIKSELDKLRTMVEKSELWVDKKGSSKGDSTVEGNKKEKKEVRALSETLGTGAGEEREAEVQLASIQHPTPPGGPCTPRPGRGGSGRVLWGVVMPQALSPCSMLLTKRSLLRERRAARTIR